MRGWGSELEGAGEGPELEGGSSSIGLAIDPGFNLPVGSTVNAAVGELGVAGEASQPPGGLCGEQPRNVRGATQFDGRDAEGPGVEPGGVPNPAIRVST